MSDGETANASAIPGSEILLRRVPKRPSFVCIPNAGSSRIEPTKAALSLKPGEDGLSVNRDALLPCDGIGRAEIYDWSDNYGIEFPAAVVGDGQDAAVVPDPVDEPAGKSHALIVKRTKDKLRWDDVRARIIASATWMPEGPIPRSEPE